MNGERSCRLILVRLERTKEDEGNRGHLVFLSLVLMPLCVLMTFSLL